MLVEFSVENYRSFKDKVTFSMLASDDNSYEHSNVISIADGTRILKSAVIYGANASGKSNLIYALEFISLLLYKSRKMNPGEPIEDVMPFKLCPELKNKPSRFEVMFYSDGVKYVYGFAVTRTEVLEEYLHRFDSNSDESLVMFSRDRSLDKEYEFVNVAKPDVLEYLCQFNAENKLYLSTAVLFNYSDFNSIYNTLVDLEYFKYIAPYRALREGYFDKNTVSDTARTWIEKAVKWVSAIDVGISDIPIQENRDLFENDFTWGNDDYWDKYLKILKTIDTIHTAQATQYSANFNFFGEESLGTRNFFTTAISIAEKMSRSGVFIADELVHMHTLLVQHIVGLFHNLNENPNQSQMIFTTHDTNLLNSEIFRRDQIWFMEKNPDSGASDLYSLYDYELPENAKEDDIDIEKGYLFGIYGAIPFLGGKSNVQKN